MKNLPVRSQTRRVINSVQDILGYTELHPQVVEKIMYLYEKVQSHSENIKNIDDQLFDLRGVNMPEILRIIDLKGKEMMSLIDENNHYVSIMSDEFSTLKYRLDNIQVDEKKSREALQQTVISFVSSMQGEIRN